MNAILTTEAELLNVLSEIDENDSSHELLDEDKDSSNSLAEYVDEEFQFGQVLLRPVKSRSFFNARVRRNPQTP